MAGYVRSFRDLDVYKEARELARDVYEVSRSFPPEERYSLTDQVRRSSRSVGGSIAEAWGKRRYAAHFVSKLTDADGEQLETQHWVEVARDCDYIDDEIRNRLVRRAESIGRKLGSMMDKSDSFCNAGSRTRDDEQSAAATDHRLPITALYTREQP